MKYYVIEITTYMDGTKDSYGVYQKDNRTDALQLFHQKLAGAMKNENYKTELVQVIDEVGTNIQSEYFVREQNNQSNQNDQNIEETTK